jgi:hypothetical protein
MEHTAGHLDTFSATPRDGVAEGSDSQPRLHP